jgi:predicted RNase H-like nuclease
MGIERFIGIDLAWAEGGTRARTNETGVAAINQHGMVIDCGWTRGIEETLSWLAGVAIDGSTLVFVDAPLVVDNPAGQRLCEREVGRRYGRWKVSANSTNQSSPRLAGTLLRGRLEDLGWTYDDGRDGPPTGGLVVSECYPYTTLVGAAEFGYDQERPTYKRRPARVPTAQWRSVRAVECDKLIARMAGLATVDPPLLLASHPVSRRLLDEPTPQRAAEYKHREDLIDALLCAWTAALWGRHGLTRCQVLGPADLVPRGSAPTIVAPARPEQRRDQAASRTEGQHGTLRKELPTEALSRQAAHG